MCEVRSREKRAGTKKKKSTMVSSKKKWTVMNPIRRQMKKRNPSSGQNGQLVHWWLLIHSGHSWWYLWRDQTGCLGDVQVILRDICDTCPTLKWTSTHHGTMQDRWCRAMYNHPHASTHLVATICRTYLHSNHVAIWSKKYRFTG
jgi:hypothetical protein